MYCMGEINQAYQCRNGNEISYCRSKQWRQKNLALRHIGIETIDNQQMAVICQRM